jgi:hypothetical protein
MAKHVRRAMLPGNDEVLKRSFAEGNAPLHPPRPFTSDAASRCPSELDGKQVLDFYWTDPIDAMKRSVAKLQYNGKLYTTFKPGTSIFHPDDRALDMAKSGMVFQGALLVDTGSSPLLAVFYADASFSGQSMSHHPIYSMFVFIVIIMVIISLIHIILCSVFAQFA